MKWFVAAIVCLAAVASAKDNGTALNTLKVESGINGKIINGWSAAVGQFPWQVGIFHSVNGNRQFCGGALISDEWVLTAAHCVYGANNFEMILGATRAYDNEPGRIVMGIRQALYHPDYKPTNLVNDVAVIQLASRVSFTNNIYPIRLAKSNDYLGGGVSVRVSGWGKTSDQASAITNYLNYVDLKTITNRACLDWFISSLVLDNVVCCDGSQIQSTCNGDSGGPLIRWDGDAWTHVGVVSFVSTQGCAKGWPSGFARTQYHLDFISYNTGIQLP